MGADSLNWGPREKLRFGASGQASIIVILLMLLDICIFGAETIWRTGVSCILNKLRDCITVHDFEGSSETFKLSRPSILSKLSVMSKV
jgi:hypothetical protein